MNKSRLLSLSMAGISLAFACGKETLYAELSAVDPSLESSAIKMEGTAYNGKPCILEAELNADASLKNIKLSEDFKVDYKIPAPGSGLYGVYYWKQTFDTAANLDDTSLKLKRSLLGDADVLEGDGKPLFWGGDPVHHKFVFKPSLKAPKKVTYHSVSRIAGVIPFVVIDGECNL